MGRGTVGSKAATYRRQREKAERRRRRSQREREREREEVWRRRKKEAWASKWREIKQLVTLHRDNSYRDLITFSV